MDSKARMFLYAAKVHAAVYAVVNCCCYSTILEAFEYEFFPFSHLFHKIISFLQNTENSVFSNLTFYP